jgi:hypothetical protein
MPRVTGVAENEESPAAHSHHRAVRELALSIVADVVARAGGFLAPTVLATARPRLASYERGSGRQRLHSSAPTPKTPVPTPHPTAERTIELVQLHPDDQFPRFSSTKTRPPRFRPATPMVAIGTSEKLAISHLKVVIVDGV